jgi:pimeloyl-ACP methyl ester carboxylesterase
METDVIPDRARRRAHREPAERRTSRRFGGLAAEEYGSQDHRPSLILLHGLTFDRTMWRPGLGELAAIDPGRHALAFDLPGHGQSATGGCYGLDSVVEKVRGAVMEAGLHRPVVVGHSISAVIATVYAARYPTSGVVNVDQSLRVERFARFARSQAERIEGPRFGEVWRMFWASMSTHLLPRPVQELLCATSDPRQDLVAGYWRFLLDRSPAELAWWAAACLRDLRDAGTPYLVVAGDEPDPGYRRWLERQLPQADVAVLPDGGHFPHLAHPRRFAGCLADWLSYWSPAGATRSPSDS